MNIPRVRRMIILTVVFGVVVLSLHQYYFSKPRVLATSEVPIAFWSWRNQAPSNTEVQTVLSATNSKVLFQRAGQFDFVDDAVTRIRPVSGTLPAAPELHLVYNGTRKLLRELERLEASEVARVVADTYRSDMSPPPTKTSRCEAYSSISTFPLAFSLNTPRS